MTFILLFCFTSQTTFLAQQLKYERVALAAQEKEKGLEQLLQKHHMKLGDVHMLLVADKAGEELQVFAKSKRGQFYSRLCSFPVCRISGELGPKNQSGDLQTPEGFYYIDRFNPSSTYYLSLGINYPNSADKKRSKSSNLGGDIFIHGKCVTIGCLPITDEHIKTLYLLAVHARNNGQQHIPVYIFPFQFTDANMGYYRKVYGDNKRLWQFWMSLKKGYDMFYKNHRELKVTTSADGNYLLN